MFSGMPPLVRLDSTEAQFVDAIHTTDAILGHLYSLFKVTMTNYKVAYITKY